MSCVFCDSFYHVTENCEVYISSESRKKIVQSKNLCVICLGKNCHSVSLRYFWIKCNSAKKCYICFSKTHFPAFCPDRYTAPKYFIPNINHDLFERFLKMFDAFEKLSLAIQSPTIFDGLILQPIKLIDKILNDNLDDLLHVKSVGLNNVFVCKELFLNIRNADTVFYRKILDKISSKTLTILAENVILKYYQMSAADILLLLSSRTKILKIINKSSPKITFDEIFEKASNLEEFEFNTFENNNIWHNHSFLKHKFGKNFRNLKITVSRNFTGFQKLASFMQKSQHNLKIDVYIDPHISDTPDPECFTKTLNDLHRYFVPTKVLSNCVLSVYLKKQSFVMWTNYYNCIGSFILKTIVYE